MHSIIMTSTQEAGRLLQFGVIPVNSQPVSPTNITPGFVGALIEVDNESIDAYNVLDIERVHAISVPLHYGETYNTYGAVYCTANAVILRQKVNV